jgi:hypothetical protein
VARVERAKASVSALLLVALARRLDPRRGLRRAEGQHVLLVSLVIGGIIAARNLALNRGARARRAAGSSRSPS